MTERSGLEVLEIYTGTWDVRADIENAQTATGNFTATIILDGKFLQTIGSLNTSDNSNDFDLVSLMTFDENRNTYRTWSFFSTGLVSESTSDWDATSNMMTKKTRYGDITQTTESYFPKSGIERWIAISRDRNGNVVSELQGVNTRRNESPE